MEDYVVKMGNQREESTVISTISSIYKFYTICLEYFSLRSTNDMEEGMNNVISKFNDDLKLFRIMKSKGKWKRGTN